MDCWSTDNCSNRDPPPGSCYLPPHPAITCTAEAADCTRTCTASPSPEETNKQLVGLLPAWLVMSPATPTSSCRTPNGHKTNYCIAYTLEWIQVGHALQHLHKQWWSCEVWLGRACICACDWCEPYIERNLVHEMLACISYSACLRRQATVDGRGRLFTTSPSCGGQRTTSMPDMLPHSSQSTALGAVGTNYTHIARPPRGEP